MQLFALNESEEWVSASSAIKQQDYICSECRSRVRLRAGQFRHAHFYHLEEDRLCRQNGKSLEHLQAQFQLKRMIPELLLEHRFPVIGRIADAAWEKEKIVFEVQCSPMTSTELKARNRDYASVGWKTVWIFHEGRYNKRRFSAAEWAVRMEPHYFTDMDQEGVGIFYSQLNEIHGSIRAETLFKKEIEFCQPMWNKKRVHFLNDGWDEILNKKSGWKQPLLLIKYFIIRFYIVIKAILTLFLEKACR